MILLRRLSIANRLLQGWVVYGDVYFDSRNCGTRRDGQSERRAYLLLTQTHPPTHPVYNERGGAAHAHAYARAFINPTPTHPPTVVGRGGGGGDAAPDICTCYVSNYDALRARFHADLKHKIRNHVKTRAPLTQVYSRT